MESLDLHRSINECTAPEIPYRCDFSLSNVTKTGKDDRGVKAKAASPASQPFYTFIGVVFHHFFHEQKHTFLLSTCVEEANTLE